MKEYLESSWYIDHGHPAIRRAREEILTGSAPGDKHETARRIFYFVRDRIEYKIRFHGKRFDLIQTLPHFFRASNILIREYGYCIHKAILLAALGRSAGIPSRLHFVNIINHKTGRDLRAVMGGDVFLWHGYVEFFLDGKWIKANPAFDMELCQRAGYPSVEFDGYNHAMFPKHDSRGEPFVEYTKDHGCFRNVPWLRIILAWITGYSSAYIRSLLPGFLRHREKGEPANR
jgi:transglutaminase-like putative cysteine protease